MNAIYPEDFESASPVFRGKRGRRLVRFMMRITAINKFNRVYDKSSHLTGSEFMSDFLKGLGVQYLVGNAERLKSLPDGAFINISNHPYGGLDGTITIDLMIAVPPDYKFMVNKLRSYMKTCSDSVFL
jgi:hypothetical protein